MKLNKLSPEEENVIINKGTERAFTGEYDEFFETGTYVCRRCEAPLYSSKNKFDAHCGWPAFDQEISGAVKHASPDAVHKLLGANTELYCARCNAYLGHDFKGEGFTSTNTRHCVNSISMKFIPEKGNKDGKKK